MDKNEFPEYLYINSGRTLFTGQGNYKKSIAVLRFSKSVNTKDEIEFVKTTQRICGVDDILAQDDSKYSNLINIQKCPQVVVRKSKLAGPKYNLVAEHVDLYAYKYAVYDLVGCDVTNPKLKATINKRTDTKKHRKDKAKDSKLLSRITSGLITLSKEKILCLLRNEFKDDSDVLKIINDKNVYIGIDLW